MAAATFLAFRPRSSSELLSLRKRQIEQSLNTVPTINRQDSSEQTARVRKYASAVAYKHGGVGWQVVGDSATMVKYKASSVVQAQTAGSVYRAAASSYQPRVQYMTPGCSNILPNFMQYGPRNPKVVGCTTVISNANPQVDPFNPVVELPLRKNDNKVVIKASSVNTAGCGTDQ